jgi:hypothetical protein
VWWSGWGTRRSLSAAIPFDPPASSGTPTHGRKSDVSQDLHRNVGMSPGKTRQPTDYQSVGRRPLPASSRGRVPTGDPLPFRQTQAPARGLRVGGKPCHGVPGYPSARDTGWDPNPNTVPGRTTTRWRHLDTLEHHYGPRHTRFSSHVFTAVSDRHPQGQPCPPLWAFTGKVPDGEGNYRTPGDSCRTITGDRAGTRETSPSPGLRIVGNRLCERTGDPAVSVFSNGTQEPGP